jgi:hypothetical protein
MDGAFHWFRNPDLADFHERPSSRSLDIDDLMGLAVQSGCPSGLSSETSIGPAALATSDLNRAVTNLADLGLNVGSHGADALFASVDGTAQILSTPTAGGRQLTAWGGQRVHLSAPRRDGIGIFGDD